MKIFLIISLIFLISNILNEAHWYYSESCIAEMKENTLKDYWDWDSNFNICWNTIIWKLNIDAQIIWKPFYKTYFSTEENYQFRFDNELKLLPVNGSIINNFVNTFTVTTNEDLVKKWDVIIFNSRLWTKDLEYKEKLDKYIQDSKRGWFIRSDLAYFQKEYANTDLLNNVANSKFPIWFNVLTCENDKIIVKDNILNYNTWLPFSEKEYKEKLESRKLELNDNIENHLRKSLLVRPYSLKDNYNLWDLENNLQFLAPCKNFNKIFWISESFKKEDKKSHIGIIMWIILFFLSIGVYFLKKNNK